MLNKFNTVDIHIKPFSAFFYDFYDIKKCPLARATKKMFPTAKIITAGEGAFHVDGVQFYLDKAYTFKEYKRSRWFGFKTIAKQRINTKSVDYNLEHLSNIAKESNIPILVACQLSNDEEQNKQAVSEYLEALQNISSNK